MGISAETHHHAVDFNIFEGMEVHGIADWVITGGRVVVEDGQVKVTKGAGRFIPTLPFAPYVYDKVKEVEAERERTWVPVKRTEEDMFVDMEKPDPVTMDIDGNKPQNLLETSLNLDDHACAKE